MSSELQLPQEKQENKVPVRIVRAVLVAPIPVSELFERISAGIPIENISFSEVALIKKSSKSVHSPNLIMSIGGEVDENETDIQGVLREVGEEVTATSLAEKATVERWEKNRSDTFTYGIRGVMSPRSISMYVLPVQSRSFSVHKPREATNGPESEDKIADVVHFTPDELKILIGKGILEKDGGTVRNAGHFTIADDSSISISPEDKTKQKKVLDTVLEDVDAFEVNLKHSTLLEINKVRRIKGMNKVASLSECEPNELVRGFVGAQLRLALIDERRAELSNGPHVLDGLLKALPYLASKLPAHELPNILYSIPNREGKRVRSLLQKGFAEGAEVIVSHFSDHDRIRSVSNSGCSEEELRNVWPKFLELPLVDRVGLLKKADDQTVKGIIRGSSEDITVDDVRVAVGVAEQNHDFITNELGELDEKFFQEHRPMNEISNSLLFTRMIYTLGLHPNVAIEDAGQDELRNLRFEAVRDLVVFATALEVAKKLRESDNSLFQGAIDTFFQFPPIKEDLNLGNGNIHPIYHRATKIAVGGKELHVIIDERSKKTAVSGARKRFQSPEMNDMFSINFALADDNFKDSSDPAGERLRVAQEFRDSLLAHIQSELGSGWTVSIMRKNHKRKSLDRVKEFWDKDDDFVNGVVTTGGGRAGSNENAIIREKFILCIENDQGISQMQEVAIYPFESSNAPDLRKLGKAGFWGFAEKLLDDYQGNYKAKRMLERDPDHPTTPSLYERLYPRRFYPTLSDRMRAWHIKSRKSQM